MRCHPRGGATPPAPMHGPRIRRRIASWLGQRPTHVAGRGTDASRSLREGSGSGVAGRCGGAALERPLNRRSGGSTTWRTAGRRGRGAFGERVKSRRLGEDCRLRGRSCRDRLSERAANRRSGGESRRSLSSPREVPGTFSGAVSPDRLGLPHLRGGDLRTCGEEARPAIGAALGVTTRKGTSAQRSSRTARLE